MKALSIPPETERMLQRAFRAELDQAALEALMIEGYRTSKLSAGEVARALGLETSIAALDWLAHRGVPLNYSLEDLEADRAALARLFPEMAR